MHNLTQTEQVIEAAEERAREAERRAAAAELTLRYVVGDILDREERLIAVEAEHVQTKDKYPFLYGAASELLRGLARWARAQGNVEAEA